MKEKNFYSGLITFCNEKCTYSVHVAENFLDLLSGVFQRRLIDVRVGSRAIQPVQ